MVGGAALPIVSTYASNVGALVINLASKGYMIRLQTEQNLFNNSVLYIQVNDMKSGGVVKHALSEQEVADITDINVIVDAIIERLKGQKKK